MVAGEVIHSFSGTNFTDYYYYEVLIPNGVVAVINGVTMPTMVSPITIPVGISSLATVAGSGAIFLIGRKKPEAMNTLLVTTPFVPSGSTYNTGNSIGSYSIR